MACEIKVCSVVVICVIKSCNYRILSFPFVALKTSKVNFSTERNIHSNQCNQALFSFRKGRGGGEGGAVTADEEARPKVTPETHKGLKRVTRVQCL